MPTVVDREIERIVERKLAVPRRQALPVRFSPLLAEVPPDARRRRRMVVGASIGLHVLLVVVVTLLPKRAPAIEDPVVPIQFVFTASVPSVPQATPPRFDPPPAPRPRIEPTPEPRIVPRVEPPPPVAETPQPRPKPVAPEPAPVARPLPVRPRPEVKLGLLDETPSGPAIAASPRSRSAIVAGGFDGEAGAAAAPARPGRVMAAAFDEAPAVARRPRAEAGVVRDTGFAEEAAAPRKREPERGGTVAALDTDVEILTKPKPAYTDEARALKLEGDVVLDVVFEASGALRVLGMAQGLGHGLDEAAIVAARKIQFTPARRDGRPVDHPAKLRVVFRLA